MVQLPLERLSVIIYLARKDINRPLQLGHAKSSAVSILDDHSLIKDLLSLNKLR